MGGNLALAGDFNNDGVPDIAGPVVWANDVCTGRCPPRAQNEPCSPGVNQRIFCTDQPNPGSDLFVFGISLGGILSGILPAVQPGIVAAAPTSGAGGLADVGIRSTLDQVVQAVFLELFGPLFATCPFSPSSGPIDAQTGMRTGACEAGKSDAQNMLVLVVQDVNRERDIPIAALTLQPGQGVTVRNLAQTSAACTGEKIDGCSYGTADSNGQLRLPVAADWPSLRATRTKRGEGQVDLVKVEVLQPGDRLEVSVGGKVIDKFQAASRFYGVDYKPGDPLVSPARGYGTSRNTPEFRRLMQLSQTILEPGDPVNYAPYYFKGAQPLLRRGPSNVLVIATSGDPGVPVNTGIALGRAARLFEMTEPDPAYGMPIDQVLVRSGAVEGVPGTHRFDDPGGGVFAALPGHVRCDPGSNCSGDVLIDPTGYSCDANGANCTDKLGAPRLSPPLRQQLVQVSRAGGAPCPVSVRSQIAAGCWSTNASACAATAPATASGPAISGPGLSALLIPYLNREGQHGFRNPQPQKAFNMDQFMANVVGRFFECRGTELRFEKCQQDLASCPWIPAPPP
jgi:hypothetical protein